MFVEHFPSLEKMVQIVDTHWLTMTPIIMIIKIDRINKRPTSA